MTQYPASDVVSIIGTPGAPGRITFADVGGDALTIQAAVGTSTYSIELPASPGVAGEVLQLTGSTQLSWVTPTVSSSTNFWFLSDVKSTGTNGGTSSLNTWLTRDLNTIVPPTGGNTDVQLAVAPAGANQILVQPGEYAFEALVPFRGASNVKTRLQDITNGTTLINGMSSYALFTTDVPSGEWGITSVIFEDIAIVAPTVLEVQYNQANNGDTGSDTQGIATGVVGKQEVYTNVRIFRVG